MTRDPEGAKKYYGETCGWAFDEMPNVDGGIYLIGMAHGKPTEGILDMTGVPHLRAFRRIGSHILPSMMSMVLLPRRKQWGARYVAIRLTFPVLAALQSSKIQPVP